MKKNAILVALAIGACIVATAVPAGAKSTVNTTAAVADGASMADGQAAATTAAQSACAKTKGAKSARVTVAAGSVTALFTIKCTAAPAAAPTTTAPAGPIFTQSGSGTATTGSFKVPSRWDLQWSYDCSNFFGGTGNFTVSIYDDYGQDSQLDLDNQGINQLGASGQGVEHYHSGGNTKFLKVISECNWTVSVPKL